MIDKTIEEKKKRTSKRGMYKKGVSTLGRITDGRIQKWISSIAAIAEEITGYDRDLFYTMYRYIFKCMYFYHRNLQEYVIPGFYSWRYKDWRNKKQYESFIKWKDRELLKVKEEKELKKQKKLLKPRDKKNRIIKKFNSPTSRTR